MTATETRYQQCREVLAARGQQGVFRWWGELNGAQRDLLLSDIEAIPWDAVDRLVQTHVLASPASTAVHSLAPANIHPCRPGAGREREYAEAVQAGMRLLRGGRVAAFTVAGGQGTRLGIDGPKGAVVVTPVGGRTLFQLFGDMIVAARQRYEAAIPWYVMTSPANHAQTVAYFESKAFFGLPEGDVMLFSQGMMPAFDRSGRLLLESRHRLAMAPDGHGGSLRALAKSGAFADMRRRGVDVISYFQVDNPLVKPFGPLFIGLHATTSSEMSTKATPKADDLERVGNVCLQDGKVVVIEYSDFPEAAARARNPDGTRTFNAGNLAIHLLDVAFAERVTSGSVSLPFRRAEKVIPFVDDQGVLQKPARPNGIKLETFIFDVLPLARDPLVLEVERIEEFSPVKNATGVDSLETSRRDQVARACRWLRSAGVPVPTKADGSPDVVVAISPRFALDAEDVRTNEDRVPPLTPGAHLYIE